MKDTKTETGMTYGLGGNVMLIHRPDKPGPEQFQLGTYPNGPTISFDLFVASALRDSLNRIL